MFSYSVGQGVVWIVPATIDETLPQSGRFLDEQIWTYGDNAVTGGTVSWRARGMFSPHLDFAGDNWTSPETT